MSSFLRSGSLLQNMLCKLALHGDLAADLAFHLYAQLKLNGFRQSGHVLALLVLNHLNRQLEWNKFLQVGQRLVGSCLSPLMIE